MIFDVVDGVKNLRCECDGFVRIGFIPKLLFVDETKQVHDFEQTNSTDGTKLFVQLDSSILVVGEQPFLDVALDDVAHGREGFAIQKDAVSQDLQVLLLIETALICNAHQIDGADAAGTHAKGCAADGVDEGVKLLCVGEQTTTVGEHPDIVADEEVGVAPSDIVVACPAGERFILELPLFVVEGKRQNRIGEHILLSGITDNLHKDLLERNEILNVVNGQGAIRELHAAKE